MIDSSRLQRIETIGEGMARRAWCLGSMVFMCLVAAAYAGTPGRSAEEDRRAVLDLEHQWLDAYDAPTLDRILADDFVHPVMTGQFLSKREHIDWTVGHPPPPTLRARFERLDVRLFGDVAIAVGIVSTEGVGDRPQRTIFTDVFARRHGRWQAISAQESEVVSRVPSRGAGPVP
jgi:ketosteroid isomerase-like protein